MSQEQAIADFTDALDILKKNYEEITLIGRGNIGIVVSASNKDGTRIAIRIVDLKGMKEQQIEYIKKELEKMKEIRHEYILPVLDIYTHENYLYIVQPYCPQSLNNLLEEGVENENKNIENENKNEILRIISMTLEGLGYLHASGNLHSNIRPWNIFIKSTGQPQISWDGLHRFIVPQTTNATDLEWMAPEWIDTSGVGERGFSTNTGDVWAVGVVLYYMLEGCQPFEGVKEQIIDMKYRAPVLAEEWKDVFSKIFCEAKDRLSTRGLGDILEEKVGEAIDKLKEKEGNIMDTKVQKTVEIYPPEYLLVGGSFREEIFLNKFKEDNPHPEGIKLNGSIYSMKLLSNSLIILGTSKGTISLFNTLTNKIQTSTQTYGGKILNIEELPGELIGIASGESHKIEIFKMRTLVRVGKLELDSPAHVVMLLMDGRLVTGTAGGRVSIWDLGSWRIVKEVEVGEGSVSQVVQLGDGRLAISKRDRSISIYDYLKEESISIPEPNIDAEVGVDSRNNACNLCELQPGILAWATKVYGTITIWNLEKAELVKSIQKERWRITKIKRFGEDKFITGSYKSARIFQMEDYTELKVFKCPGAAWDFCLYGGEGWKLPIFEEEFKLVGGIVPNLPIQEDKSKETLMQFARPIGSFPPAYIIVGGFNSEVYLYKYGTPPTKEATFTISGNTYKCQLLNNKKIAISEQTGIIHFFNPKTKSIEDEKYKSEGGKATDFTELPGNKLALASSTSKIIEIVNLNTLKKITELKHEHNTVTVDLVKGGKYIVSGDQGGYVKLWEGKGDMKMKKEVRMAEEKCVVQVLELMDGRIAVSTYNDYKLYIWDYNKEVLEEVADASIDAMMGSNTSNKTNSLCELQTSHLAWGTTSYGTFKVYNYKSKTQAKQVTTSTGRRICRINLCGRKHFMIGSYQDVVFYELKNYKEICKFDCSDQAWDFAAFGGAPRLEFDIRDMRGAAAAVATGVSEDDEEKEDDVQETYPPEKMLISGCTRKLYIRNYESGSVERIFEREGVIDYICNINKEKIWISEGGKIWIYSTKTEEINSTKIQTNTKYPKITKISEELAAIIGIYGKVEIWEIEGEKVRELDLPIDSHTISSLCATKGSLVVGTEEGYIYIYSTSTWEIMKDKLIEVVESKIAETPKIAEIQELEDGRLIISTTQGRIIIWETDFDHIYIIPNIYIPNTISTPLMCEIRPGVLVYSLYPHGALFVWDLAAQVLITSFVSSPRRITRIGNIGKGYFVCGSTWGYRVYDSGNYCQVKSCLCAEQVWGFACYGD